MAFTIPKFCLFISCYLLGVFGANSAEESLPLSALGHGIPLESPARENATFLVLSRNSDVYGLARSIRSVEDRFNRQYGYDWVFLNDVPFDEEFINVTSSLISGKAKYGLIPKEHWSYPTWIDQDKAAEVRKQAANKYIYGDSESYRHMCRFFSGFFFKHELLQPYKYYWRVEPDIELLCDVQYDPFQFMRMNNKMISFVISLYELPETITTLWQTVKGFFKLHPQYLAKTNSRDLLSEDRGKTYNRCHFWSNFEIGSLDWFREQSYQDYFDYLDQAGGFFYERWGDAPVHTIAAGTLLNGSQIHFFEDIGYSHGQFLHCPTGVSKRQQLKCHCNPAQNVDWFSVSCLPHWLAVNQLPYPEGYEEELPRVKAEECRVLGCEDEIQAEDQDDIVEDLKEIYELRKKIEDERAAKERGVLPDSMPHNEL